VTAEREGKRGGKRAILTERAIRKWEARGVKSGKKNEKSQFLKNTWGTIERDKRGGKEKEIYYGKGGGEEGGGV